MTVTLASSQATAGDLIRYIDQNPPHTTSDDLLELALESKNVLFSFSSIFPLDLFPDVISIDENKVNIIHRNFFGVANIHSILLMDITDIVVDTYILFATLTIIDSSNYRFPIVITTSFVKIDDALKARDLIQGLIAAKRQKINLKGMPREEVLSEAEIAGKIFR